MLIRLIAFADYPDCVWILLIHNPSVVGVFKMVEYFFFPISLFGVPKGSWENSVDIVCLSSEVMDYKCIILSRAINEPLSLIKMLHKSRENVCGYRVYLG